MGMREGEQGVIQLDATHLNQVIKAIESEAKKQEAPLIKAYQAFSDFLDAPQPISEQNPYPTPFAELKAIASGRHPKMKLIKERLKKSYVGETLKKETLFSAEGLIRDKLSGWADSFLRRHGISDEGLWGQWWLSQSAFHAVPDPKTMMVGPAELQGKRARQAYLKSHPPILQKGFDPKAEKGIVSFQEAHFSWNRKDYTIERDVPYSKNAVRDAHESWLGRAMFKALSEVDWSKNPGMGGAFFSKNENDEDDYSESARNHLSRCFGRRGDIIAASHRGMTIEEHDRVFGAYNQKSNAHSGSSRFYSGRAPWR